MKGYQRREAGISAYCNLDIWSDRLGCWTKTKTRYESVESAMRAIRKPGRYRVSRTEDGRRIELEPFDLPDRPGGDNP